uniref:Uncharacterized protein n=1 Tax=uncultured Rhizobium sp. HF0130_09F11 TaxID=723625 RepID=E7C2K6_9HYPH|nr:hypothetical protein [uncultured Rhizobium sp. HF0130_09F11]
MSQGAPPLDFSVQAGKTLKLVVLGLLRAARAVATGLSGNSMNLVRRKGRPYMPAWKTFYRRRPRNPWDQD